MNCTRCSGTGFLNLEHLEELDPGIFMLFEQRGDHNMVLNWIKTETRDHDVSVCDCCGNGEDWFGTPGMHTRSGREWDCGRTPDCI